MIAMISFSKLLKENRFPQIAALVLLLLLLGFGAVPGYFAGHWQWQQLQSPTTLKQLKQLHRGGLKIPGWQTTEQRDQQIGGRRWSLQVMKKEGLQKEVMLLLLPQKDGKDQPQVEWTEMNGFWQWDVAQERSAEFSVTQQADSPQKVQARFFRGSTKQQTFSVLQWYAMPNGGNPSPLKWFLADQLAQLRKSRTPWVAVSILIPMEPLGQLETTWDEAQSIGKTVQAALLTSSL
jgi:cyanoexosortase B-associated protein